MAYATVADLEARLGRTLMGDERAQASVLLEDAAAMLTALVSPIDPEDPVQAANLKTVNCAMVARVILSGANGAYGVTDSTATMGPFSQHLAFSNPTGDLYISKAERALLGIGRAVIGAIRPVIEQKTVHHARA